jgi:hypothetical protein
LPSSARNTGSRASGSIRPGRVSEGVRIMSTASILQ